MKSGWPLRTVGELCEVVNGGTPDTGVAAYWGGPHAWITPAEMGGADLPVAATARTLTDEGLRNSSAKLIPRNSVILSSRAPIGYVVINACPMATNQGCKGLIPGSHLDAKFLYYYLGSIKERLEQLGTGATFPELSIGRLKTCPIPCPPIGDQRRIVSIIEMALSNINAAQSATVANVRNATALFEGEVESIFRKRGNAWVERRLQDLCDIKHGFAFKGEYFSDSGEYVLLTPGNFYESGGYRDRGKKQKFYIGEVPSGYILSKGDLLVAMTEQAAGLLGSPILVPESGRFLHNQRLGLVTAKPNSGWVNEFFFHVFNLKGVRKAIHDGASGAKVRHTSPAKIGAVMVAFPPDASAQRAVVSRLNQLREEINRLESVYKAKSKALVELREAILHKAFAGRI